MSMWFALKDFKTRISQVRVILFVIAFLSADFTFIFVFLKGWSNIQIFIPMLIFVATALATALLHLEDKTSQGIGVLKALGAKQSTIVLIFLIELTLVGVIGVFSGILLGLASLLVVSSTAQINLFEGVALTEAFGLLVSSCLSGVLVGVLVCVFSTWKKSARMVVEALAHTR